MVPQKSLYNMNFANKIKTMNATFISNSKYTQNLLQSWQVNSQVIYPFIGDEFLQNYSEKKEKQILVVGRFFKQLHAKRQDLAIKWFKTFQKENKLKDYKLILAGNVKEEDKTYFDELQEMALGDKSITLYPNCSFSELLTLYKKSEIYWHMTGIDIDEKNFPEKVEHLGITPLEAMASGCIVFGYNAGGLKELITDGSNGYLFSNEKELITKFEHIISNPEQKKQIRESAFTFVKEQFNYSVFAKRVKKIML
jgi:glycosyltransferase involved in cell wall biosynthesis